MNNRSSRAEVQTKITTNTHDFLETCVLDADDKALEEHLLSNPVQQNDLDSCLSRGLQIVQRKDKELSHVAPALTMLLQSGAKWNNDVLLADQKTPCHFICESPGDHHELLDLIIKSREQTIVNTQDVNQRTSLMCAVENSNINCVKCLIANGACVITENLSEHNAENKSTKPIMRMIWMLRRASKQSSVILTDIFDLLLEAAVVQDKDFVRGCKDFILCAINVGDVHCINKLIKIGAPLDAICHDGFYVLSLVTMKGNVELLKSMFNRGFDKNTIDENGLSVLCWVVKSGNVEAVRYVLELGVDIPNFSPEVRKTQCEQCGENRLTIEGLKEHVHRSVVRIFMRTLEIVKLLEEYGNESCKSFYALSCAVRHNRVDIY